MSQHKSSVSKNKREKRPPKKITSSYLHNAGLYYLERFAASKMHFRNVMLRKIKKSCAFHEEQCYEDCIKMLEDTIQAFERSGLLDDKLYARGLAVSLRRKGFAKSMILRKMQYKGVEAQDSEIALGEHDELLFEAEYEAALRLVQRKKIGCYAISEKQHDEKRALGILARAGFSYDIAKRALSYDPDDGL